ncbi:MAG: hypothetical protein ACPG5B_17050 [Chitinophagales bacterium]
MKNTLLKILIVIEIFGCTNCQIINQTSSKTKFDIKEELTFSYALDGGRDNYNGEIKRSKLTYDNQSIMGEGKITISNNEEINHLKIGKWLTYYENGQIKTKGKYEIGKYIQCCCDGPCRQYYNYKSGMWKYFYPNGKLLAKGKYDIKSLHLNTSCEGGAELNFGIINDSWKFYNEENQEIAANDSIRIELEKVNDDSFVGSYLIPNKDREKISFEK